jgi:hypothetical protein
MRKSLFVRIVQDVTTNNRYFVQRRNAANIKGFTPIHKCLIALRMLACGGAADSLDDPYKWLRAYLLFVMITCSTGARS